MAIRPIDIYPGQVITDAAYPHGKARNQITEDDGTGTPLEERIVNDIFGLEQALLDEGRVTPSGSPDAVGASDYLTALKRIAAEQATRHAAFDWTPQPVYDDNGLDINRNGATDPPLIYPAGERWLVKTPLGGTGIAFHSRQPGQGLALANPSQTERFKASANSGSGADATLLTSRSLTRILAIPSGGGTVRRSDDWGATWSDAGTVSLVSQCGGFFDGAWHAVHTELDGTHLVSSSSSLTGAWTVTDVDPSGTVDAAQYVRFVAASSFALFLPTGSSAQTDLLINSGAGWGVSTIGAASSNGWRGDWNETLGQAMIANSAGQCWQSSDGITWTLAFSLNDTIYDVAAFGRGWVLSCSTGNFPYLRFLSHDGTAFGAERLPWESPAEYPGRFHLMRWRGRVLAGKINEDDEKRLEWWESGASALAIDANGF